MPLTRLDPLGFFRNRQLSTKLITLLPLLHDERCAKCVANHRDAKILSWSTCQQSKDFLSLTRGQATNRLPAFFWEIQYLSKLLEIPKTAFVFEWETRFFSNCDNFRFLFNELCRAPYFASNIELFRNFAVSYFVIIRRMIYTWIIIFQYTTVQNSVDF